MGVKKNAQSAPLYDGLRAYLSRNMLGFHTPGHTGGRAFDLAALAGMDITELPVSPGGPSTPALVRQAEILAAELFGAAHTFFLTNGASLGVLAMILASCATGSSVALERNCHLSAMNACVLGDLRPVFLEPVYDPSWSFPLGTRMDSTRSALAAGQTVLLTNPTYQGAVMDLTPLASLNGSLLVDEAHGTHLAFGDGQKGARAGGALSWVHGCHKTLGSMTQTGMLHLNAGVPVEPYANWLGRLASTSPSFPLLASLDLARQWAAREGLGAWRRAGERLERLRRTLKVAGLQVLETSVLPAGAVSDPAKLTVAAPGGGPSAARRLQQFHGLQAEAVGYDWITFLVTPFHTDEELERLASALLAGEGFLGSGGTFRAPWPKRALWPREASLSRRRYLPPADAQGMVAAEPLCVYPPGTPLIWPGEIVEADLVGFIETLKARGIEITGFDCHGRIAVVDI